MFMSALRDLLSPTNLWQIANWLCPWGTGAVSALLSWVWNLPPSITLMAALMSAAAALIIVDSYRETFERNDSKVKRIKELEDRLSPKIRIYLPCDPIKKIPGIEFAKNEKGDDVPYIQVIVESLTDASIKLPVVNFTRTDHRNVASEEFKEVFAEPIQATWSQQESVTRLSKGNPIRFNVGYYNDKEYMPDMKANSNKLIQFYRATNRTGEYRYRVHIDGDDVVALESYLYVKWTRDNYHPEVMVESIEAS